MSTIQGRGWVGTAVITGTRDGEILGYELRALCDMGAYTQNFTVAIPLLGLWVSAGQYDIPAYFEAKCVVTNTQTTDAYRGAGRPEALYYIERIIDAYAREIGMDPAEVRRKNYWKNDQFPAVTNFGLAIDSGDYETNLDKLLDMADYAGLRQMQDDARAEGRYIGIGLSTYLEICGFGPSVLSEIGFGWNNYGLPSSFSGSGLVRVNPDGSATVIIGTGPSGQGHETTWSQIVSSVLGIDTDMIRVSHGDTAESPMGVGTFGSRSAAVDGAATYEAAVKVRDKAAEIAAHLLEAAPEDIALRRRRCPRCRHAGTDGDMGGDRRRRLPAASGAGGPRRRSRGPCRVQPRQRHMAIRVAHRRRRGRSGDGRCRLLALPRRSTIAAT